MLRGYFRPWGPLQWTLKHLQARSWSFFGTLSTEHRCLSTWNVINTSATINKSLIITIKDLPSSFDDEIELNINERKRDFLRIGGDPDAIKNHHLFELDDQIIIPIKEFAKQAGDNVIIDISSCPKKFFFLAIKFILKESGIKNIIATYTIPEKYGNDNFPLAQDPEPWRHIPSFMPPYPEQNEKTLIVGVGYEPLGLPKMLEGDDFKNADVKLLFPFPAPPQGFQKNWNFVRQLSPAFGASRYEIVRVNTHNVSEIFDRILSLTDRGRRYSILAPFGPKPLSLAMCLFAISDKVQDNVRPSVYYTQPRVYHPRYSEGVKNISGIPSICSYCIRINGVNLY